MGRRPREQRFYLTGASCLSFAVWTFGCGSAEVDIAAAAPVPELGDQKASEGNVPAAPVGVQEGRVDFEYSGALRSSTSLGIGSAELRGIEAVAGRIRTPKWAARPQEGPERLRDSNLESQWRCTAQQGRACAWGVNFPQATALRTVRIDGGKSVLEGARLHTEHGYIELPTVGIHETRYLVLEPAVELSWLSLVVETGEVSLSEVELYGTGKARPPIRLDPMRLEPGGSSPSWVAGEGGTWRLAPGACLRVGGVCLLRATALYGWPQERFWLAELVSETDCRAAQGVYRLVDTQTRRIFELSKAARPAALVHRHTEGKGWAVAQGEGFVAATVDAAGEPIEVTYGSADEAREAGFAPRGMTRRAGSISIDEHCPGGFGVPQPQLPVEVEDAGTTSTPSTP